MPNLIQQAVSDLNIDVPIMRTEPLEGGGLTLYLYGGPVVTWIPPLFSSPPTPSPPSPNPGGGEVPVIGEGSRGGSQVDDFTTIPGVGKATANALIAAGYYNFAHLRAATNQQLLQVQHVNTRTLAHILDFLETPIEPET